MLKMMKLLQVPNVPIIPKVKPRRGTTTPAPVSTQPVEVAKKVTYAKPASEVNDSSLLSIEEDN